MLKKRIITVMATLDQNSVKITEILNLLTLVKHLQKSLPFLQIVRGLKKYNIILVCLTVVLSVIGCSSVHLHFKSKELPVGWYKDSTLVFSLPVFDTITPYGLQFSLRNTDQYAYSNLFLIQMNVNGFIMVIFEAYTESTAPDWVFNSSGVGVL